MSHCMDCGSLCEGSTCEICSLQYCGINLREHDLLEVEMEESLNGPWEGYEAEKARLREEIARFQARLDELVCVLPWEPPAYDPLEGCEDWSEARMVQVMDILMARR